MFPGVGRGVSAVRRPRAGTARLLALALAVLGVVVLPVGAAHAAPIHNDSLAAPATDVFGRITPAGDPSKCLQTSDLLPRQKGGPSYAHALALVACDTAGRDGYWMFAANGTIVNAATGLCLSAVEFPYGQSLEPIQGDPFACLDGWRVTWSYEAGLIKTQNRWVGTKCLDSIPPRYFTINLSLNDCSSAASQQWSFVPWQTAVVSLGDSFISGEGGRWQCNSNNFTFSRDGTDRAWTGTGYDPAKIYGPSYANYCNRSDTAEVNSATGIAQNAINLACSGATTANIFRTTNGGQIFKGEQPQADQLAPVARQYQVKVIALSIGGNDLGFSDIIEACIKAYTLSQAPCNPAQQANIDAKIGTAKQNVIKAIGEIQATMTTAGYPADSYRIILQSAPSPLPRAAEIRYTEALGRLTTGGCPFWNADADWARDSLLNQMSDTLKSAAQSAGVDFLDLRNAFQGREVCAKASSLVTFLKPPSSVTNEWARFLVSGLAQGQVQESFHPNAFGQIALGRCLTLMAASNAHVANCDNTPGQDATQMRLTTVS